MPQHSLTDELASLGRSEDVNSKHPPDKKHCDDSSRDVNDPVTRRFRLAEIEHAAWYQPQRVSEMFHYTCELASSGSPRPEASQRIRRERGIGLDLD